MGGGSISSGNGGSVCAEIPPRYLNGNNAFLLSPESTFDALSQISNDLSLDLSQAKVVGFDFAMNVFLDNPPAAYYRFFGNSSLLTTRGNHNNKTSTLYYSNGRTRNSKNGNVELCIYDKMHELGKKNVPEAWKDCNVMRIEIRYPFKPQSHFKKEIMAASLCDPAFIDEVKKSFMKVYESIKKLPQVEFKYTSSLTQKRLIDQFAAYGVECYGYDNAMTFLSVLKAKGLLAHRTYLSKFKNELTRLITDQVQPERSALLNELDNRVNLLL